jgi:hypothetical protein
VPTTKPRLNRCRKGRLDAHRVRTSACWRHHINLFTVQRADYQREFTQPHVAHGARDSTDIARILRTNKTMHKLLRLMQRHRHAAPKGKSQESQRINRPGFHHAYRFPATTFAELSALRCCR